jgi:cellulose synthase/poly-beta-1,6-N-acetylglucosamine synthase-like glycosyltransferase
VFYIYFGYSLTVFLVAKFSLVFRSPTIDRLEDFPSVTMLIIAHNEAESLEKKLDNTMELQYEGEFDVLVVLDGCTDMSKEIVEQFIEKNSMKQWNIFEIIERVGKERALREAISTLDSDILAFSDANSTYSPDMIKKFVLQLQKPSVGAVTGHEKRVEFTESGSGKGEEFYTRYNNWIKKQEGKFASQTDVNGGVFAIWRGLYPEDIPDGATQDGVIPLHLSLLNKKVAYAYDAISIERYSLSAKEDFERRIRTINRAFTAIVSYLNALNPFKTGFFSFQIIFHRMLRWFFVIFSILIFFSNLGLYEASLLYKILFVGQVAFYLFAIIGFFVQRSGKRILLFYIPYYFNYIHIAAIIAVFQVFRGKKISIWTPSSK